MEMDLIARADELQRQACQLADRLRYPELWAACGGKAILVGSARTGLMAEPNLDFNILMPAERPDIRACCSVLSALVAATEAFPEANFFLNSHLTEPDPYLYIGFGFQYAGVEWTWDNEIFGCRHPRRHTARRTTEALLRVLDAETRLRILHIKDERRQINGESWRGSSVPGSLDIYRAVFDGGARTLAECQDWIAAHPGREDYFWLPPGGE